MEYTIIIIFFVLLYFTSKVTWPFSGKNAHPINFVLFTQIFILTLPGVHLLHGLYFCFLCFQLIFFQSVSLYTFLVLFQYLFFWEVFLLY